MLIDLDRINATEIRPGDVVVLSVAYQLTAKSRDIMRERIASTVPGVKVLILDPGMDLRVLRPDADAAARLESMEADAARALNEPA